MASGGAPLTAQRDGRWASQGRLEHPIITALPAAAPSSALSLRHWHTISVAALEMQEKKKQSNMGLVTDKRASTLPPLPLKT